MKIPQKIKITPKTKIPQKKENPKNKDYLGYYPKKLIFPQKLG